MLVILIKLLKSLKGGGGIHRRSSKMSDNGENIGERGYRVPSIRSVGVDHEMDTCTRAWSLTINDGWN